MKMYKEAGVNPFGSCLPMLVQFPVLIGLYQAINLAMAASPIQLLDLSRHIYPFIAELPFLTNPASHIPLQNEFLWLNLGLPDPIHVLPLLVVVTTWLQSKVMQPATPMDNQQAAAMSQQMTLMMPLMIGWMSLQFPSGLSIYWVIGNVVSIVQYAVTSPVNWRNVFSFRPASAAGADDKSKSGTGRSDNGKSDKDKAERSRRVATKR
jgi:YidC/Oxa1 family membrane protein insertase